LPDQPLATWVVEIEAQEIGDAELARRLRIGNPPVVGRLRDGKVVLDMRTVFARQQEDLIAACASACC
jgi:L-seryl-tRNA(Ser) seleniumtransferase